jgi:hypothetical protein
MTYESIHNSPQDAMEEIFVRLEEKFTDISCKMALLMVVLENKYKPFGEVAGGFN